jgi:hypothetical protein
VAAGDGSDGATVYFGLILAGLINGVDREEVLGRDWEPLLRLGRLHPLNPEIAGVAAGSFREKEPPHITGSGYVVRSLEAAQGAFHDAQDFRQAVLKAVKPGRRRLHDRGCLRAIGWGLLG